MAQVRRDPRPTLEDLINVADPDSAVDDLLDMSEREFDDAVLLYLRGHRHGMEVMRHPDVVEQLYEALTRLRADYRLKVKRAAEDGTERTRHARMLMAIEIERREVRVFAEHERTLRLADEASEAKVRRIRREEARLERALALRRQLDEAQKPPPRKRAMERLAKEYPQRFLQLVREEQERDRRGSESAAGDEPPAARSVPAQALRRA